MCFGSEMCILWNQAKALTSQPGEWLKVHFNSRGIYREEPCSAAELSCQSQVFLRDASPKVIWVIVKEATTVQNAMAFLFICVSKDYLEVFFTLQEDSNVSHYLQRRKYILKSFIALAFRKEASTKYLLQVLGKKLKLLSLALKETEPGLSTDTAVFYFIFLECTASREKCNAARIPGESRAH